MNSLVYVFLLLLLVVACDSHQTVEKEIKDGVVIVHNPEYGVWQKDSIPPVSFELEQVFGKEEEPEEEVLAGIGSVFTDDHSNVYVFDWKLNRLVAFSPEGNFLWATGREGQGPGEFSSVLGAVCDGQNYIYVSNITGTRIDRFDLQGNYQHSYVLSNLKIDRVRLQGIIKPDVLVATRNKMEESSIEILLLKAGESLQIARRIDVTMDVGVKIPPGFGISFDLNVLDSVIVVANNHQYEFKYFNDQGKLIKVVTRDFDKLVPPGILIKDNTRVFRIFSWLMPPMKLPGGYQISYSSWPVNLKDPRQYMRQAMMNNAPRLIYRGMLDIFNREGELLYSIDAKSAVAKIGHILHVDSNGKLYTSFTDTFPQIRRYKVTITRAESYTY